ncbi:MAG: NAD(P)-dependent oxidoreductase [Tannerellaceae bacterium]|nr:NAD(P)-dependent oxidoreductase [Tannerellaceae bacterium]
MTTKKILITGASGFIGGFLVEEALRRGYETWAGIRAGSNRSHLQDKRIRFIDLKYGNREALTEQLTAFVREHGAWDYVVHNAGVTKVLNKDDFFRVNAGYAISLIEALEAANCKPGKFLLMSSLSTYGKGDEKNFTPIRLDDPQLPDTAYGKSKLEAECHLSHQAYFPYLILRPTGVYGPGDKDYFMAIKAVGAGFDLAVGFTPQRITFIYVKDLAVAVFLALENEQLKNKHYFVADGDVYTDTEFARKIQNSIGKKFVWHVRMPAGLVYIVCMCSEWTGKLLKKRMTLNSDKYMILKQRNWICDVKPLQDDTGFSPAYPLHKGLEESIAWYKKEGWL